MHSEEVINFIDQLIGVINALVIGFGYSTLLTARSPVHTLRGASYKVVRLHVETGDYHRDSLGDQPENICLKTRHCAGLAVSGGYGPASVMAQPRHSAAFNRSSQKKGQQK
jgi:hypothetical protein